MESRGPAEPTDLRALDIAALRQAVDIYLRIAYDGASPSDAVRRRLDWPDGVDAEALMSGPPFEQSGKTRSTGATIYAIRLGNARYPHMKLQVQPWPNSAGFMLSVNTHDQVLTLDASTVDLPAFREIQAENKRLKELIEQAWDDAGLPTFLRYLREYIEQRGGHVEPDSLPVPPGTDPNAGL